MSAEIITLQLKRDQIFGLHVNVPTANVDAVCVVLDENLLEFERAGPGTERLHESGRTTLLLFDDIEDVRFAFSEDGAGERLMDEVELLPPHYDGPFAQLLAAGEPPLSAGAPAKCEAWGFTAADIPGLISLMSDDELHCAPSSSDAV